MSEAHSRILLTTPVVEILKTRLIPELALPPDFEGRVTFTLHFNAGTVRKFEAVGTEIERS
jgi:hypothetical protein